MVTKNIELNTIHEKNEFINCAVTKSFEKLWFTKAYDTINHVATDLGNLSEIIYVEGLPLDKICENCQPCLLKIDVEGFETNVIKGGIVHF